MSSQPLSFIPDQQADWRMDSALGIEIETHSGMKREPLTGSTLEVRNGFYILHLWGKPYERGRAHGKLLREKIRESRITRYYGSFLLNLYRSSDFIRKVPGFIKDLLGDLLEWWFYSPLEKMALEETRDELYGVADGSGLERKEVLRAVLAPDLMERLAVGLLKGSKEALGRYSFGGCSGVYARNTALKEPGLTLFARNLDFPGAVIWKYPTLVFTHPSESAEVMVRTPEGRFELVRKPKQPYMYISAAGFPGHGLTGMNASGVALGNFACLSRNLTDHHLLTLDFNHLLLTRAEGIEAALALLEKKRLKSCSPHTVAMADRQQAVTVEVDSVCHALRPMYKDFDFLVQTNHFLTPKLKRREIEFPLVREHTLGRYRLLMDALEENNGRIDIRRMIDIIACNLDRANPEARLLGDFPAQMVTLTSAVFELSSGNFWVASGKPPGICFNDYRGFNFQQEIAGTGAAVSLPSFRRSHRPVFKGFAYKPVTAAVRESLRQALLSQEELKKGKIRLAIRGLEKARSLHAEPGYEYLLGILYLLNDQARKALETLRQARAAYSFPPLKSAALALWEARCLDLLGKREEAQESYRQILLNSDLELHLRKVLKRSLKKPFTLVQLPGTVDYTLLGPLEFR